ncbi:MAG: hypothetical protein ACRENP_07755 [Longimicrobiales bacterium]
MDGVGEDAGETHNFGFDKDRNIQLVNAISASKTLTLVVERAMFTLDARIYPNVITEANTNPKPSAPERNTDIVVQLLKFTASLPSAERKRPVVFVFGQDHETKIQAEVERQFQVDDKIQWLTFKSVDDQVTELARNWDTMPDEFELLGFVSDSDTRSKRQELEMRLLAKGYVPQPFNVKVYSGGMLPTTCREPTAIYCCDVQKRTNCSDAIYENGFGLININDEKKVRGNAITLSEARKL